MIGLLLFKNGHNLKVLGTFFKSFTLDLFNIIHSRMVWCLSSLNLGVLSIYILLESLFFHLSCLVLFLKSLRFSSDFHQLTGIIIIIFLQFLQFSSLLEQSFRGSSALIFKNLFFLEISSFSSLYKFITIVLISHFKMIQSIDQSFNFFFTFSKFSV